MLQLRRHDRNPIHEEWRHRVRLLRRRKARGSGRRRVSIEAMAMRTSGKHGTNTFFLHLAVRDRCDREDKDRRSGGRIVANQACRAGGEHDLLAFFDLKRFSWARCAAAGVDTYHRARINEADCCVVGRDDDFS